MTEKPHYDAFISYRRPDRRSARAVFGAYWKDFALPARIEVFDAWTYFLMRTSSRRGAIFGTGSIDRIQYVG